MCGQCVLFTQCIQNQVPPYFIFNAPPSVCSVRYRFTTITTALCWNQTKGNILCIQVQLVTERKGCICSTYAASSPSKTATFLLCLRPLYDFCNEITVCFPDQWVLLIVLATFLSFFPIQGVLYTVCISVAAALTRASTCETKMLISQTVPIGIMPRSASGEG